MKPRHHAAATFRIWRGQTAEGGDFQDYTDRGRRGHGGARRGAPDSGRAGAATSPCRWNCKAGKCGSCSAEINGMPQLMCMTRLRHA